MGGHEHHREGHKSSRSGVWEGSEKLKKALEGLATAKGVSQSRIGAVAKLASHYSKFYKHVVHDIEVFLWKAEVEHRLAGLYAIDAIIRQSHTKNGSKDTYVKRFSIRMADTIAAVKKVPEQFQPKVRHVIEEWQKRGIYTSKQIEDLGGHEYMLQEDRTGNVTPRASPGKLASLLSIIKQKKEEKDHASDQHGRPPYDDRERHQRADSGAYSHHSYDERRGNDQRPDRRDVGGIMGDAPGIPVGSRMRRDPDDRPGALNDRDPKKARGSRWGPSKSDNVSSNDRPSPIITSFDRDGAYRQDNGRSGYGSPPGSSRQTSILQSPREGPPRHEEWNRNAPPSRGSGAGWPRENVRSPQSGGLGRQNVSPYEQGGMQRSPFSGSDDRRSPGNRIPGTSGELCRNFLAGRCTFGDRCWHMHDPRSASSGGGRSEMAELKRKTVLCNNYPLGMCRFGDKCRYYSISSIDMVTILACIFSSMDHFLMMDSLCGPCCFACISLSVLLMVKKSWTSLHDIRQDPLPTATKVEVAGNRRRVKAWSNPASRLLLMHLHLLKLDLMEPRKYIMNHTVIAAVEEVIHLCLMLMPLRHHQMGAGCCPITKPSQGHPHKFIRALTPRLRLLTVPVVARRMHLQVKIAATSQAMSPFYHPLLVNHMGTGLLCRLAAPRSLRTTMKAIPPNRSLLWSTMTKTKMEIIDQSHLSNHFVTSDVFQAEVQAGSYLVQELTNKYEWSHISMH
ncbi:hypothetical protein F441_19278 [Phytophthora nicotianae CJ01A1]|uniref:C3H1-type domain-containing protein n=2 Tax=Phytophthora nicotianae TaxID=4792 RepID=W2FU39_PHYNI|nr:hypothetical protein L915_18878 [Phytophthora nicotianae]ETL27709.1 hypothetical protein L916_18773 [Phytophthora nicotianae]ETP03791.1 hypothetical protein F441_19278 [Phytophthora nicotianae CJ01A1]